MKITGERFFSVFLLIICVVWLGYSGKISDSTMPGTPGPVFFPSIILGILAFLIILNEALSIRRSLREGKREESAAIKTSQPKETLNRKKIILSFILIFLYVLGIEYLGFYLSSFIMIFVALKGIITLQNWLKVLLSTVVITASIFIIFSLFLNLPLPRGIAF